MTFGKYKADYKQWFELVGLYESGSSVKNSKTIPSRSMSVREIMDRYAKGLPMDSKAVKVPLYHGDADEISGRDPRSFDLVEQKEIMDEKLEKLKADIEEQNKDRSKKQVEKLKNAAVAEYLKSLEAKGEVEKSSNENENE